MKMIPSDFSPRRILVCQQRQIGDVVLTLPIISMLKAQFPNAEIHLLTEKKCVPVTENNPEIAKIWPIDKKLSIWQSMRFYWKVARQNFDLVIDMQQLPRIRWVVLFSMAKYRLTYTPKWYNRWLYTHWGPRLKGGYAVKTRADILAPLGIKWEQERPKIHLTKSEKDWAEEYLNANGLDDTEVLVSIGNTHWSKTRRWPAEYYAQLMDLIVEQRPQAKFLLCYGPGEEKQVQAAYDNLQNKDRCIFPDRILSLREMAALMEHAWLHIGNCSSPKHIALAVGTPTMTMIGSTGGTAWTFPAHDQNYVNIWVPCRKCNSDTCANGTLACLRDLTPEIALIEILKEIPVDAP